MFIQNTLSILKSKLDVVGETGVFVIIRKSVQNFDWFKAMKTQDTDRPHSRLVKISASKIAMIIIPQTDKL